MNKKVLYDGKLLWLWERDFQDSVKGSGDSGIRMKPLDEPRVWLPGSQ